MASRLLRYVKAFLLEHITSVTGALRGVAFGGLATPDTNSIKLSIATAVTDSLYVTANFDGVNGGTLAAPGVNVSVTSGASVGTYKTGASNPIIFTGLDAHTGETVSESLLLTAANGGETIVGKQLFAGAMVSISVPAQNDASGAFEFGTGASVAIVPPARGVYIGATGDLVAALVDDDAASSVTYADMVEGITHPLWVRSIHESTTATSVVILR